MRYVHKVLLAVLFATPFLFSTSHLHARSGSPAVDGWPVSAGSHPDYEIDYSQVVNDESPFVGGVFDREVGEPMVPIEEEWLPDWPEPIADDDGNTNQVVILLDLDDGDVIQNIVGSPRVFETRGEAEEAVVDAINTANPDAKRFFF